MEPWGGGGGGGGGGARLDWSARAGIWIVTFAPPLRPAPRALLSARPPSGRPSPKWLPGLCRGAGAECGVPSHAQREQPSLASHPHPAATCCHPTFEAPFAFSHATAVLLLLLLLLSSPAPCTNPGAQQAPRPGRPPAPAGPSTAPAPPGTARAATASPGPPPCCPGRSRRPRRWTWRCQTAAARPCCCWAPVPRPPACRCPGSRRLRACGRGQRERGGSAAPGCQRCQRRRPWVAAQGQHAPPPAGRRQASRAACEQARTSAAAGPGAAAGQRGAAHGVAEKVAGGAQRQVAVLAPLRQQGRAGGGPHIS